MNGHIIGYIGEPDILAEMMGGESQYFSAKDMVELIASIPADDPDLHIEVRSPGGSIEMGIDIYEQLLNCGKNLTVTCYECASIATLFPLAAELENRRVTKYSMPLIHNPWIDGEYLSGMDADALAELSDAMRVQENRILDIYVERTGADRDELAAIMKQDKPITAEEFKRLGFVGEVINGGAVKVSKARAFVKAHQAQIEINMKKPILDLRAAAKALSDKIEALAKGAPKDAVKNLSVILKDETVLYVKKDEGEPAVGDEVFTDEAMTAVAPDGTHELTDGSSITIASGKITEVTPAPAAADATALQAEVDRLKAENLALTTKVNNAATALTTMTQNRDKVVNEVATIKKDFADLQDLILNAKIDEKEPELSAAQKERQSRRGGRAK